jgi:hypothetical protein
MELNKENPAAASFELVTISQHVSEDVRTGVTVSTRDQGRAL